MAAQSLVPTFDAKDPRAIGQYGRDELQRAIDKYDLRAIEALLADGASTSFLNNDPTLPPLHEAAVNECLEGTAMLLDAGVDIDGQDATGETALHVAAYNANIEIVELLVAEGADIHIVDNEGLTPLNFFEFEPHPADTLIRMRQLLVRQGPTSNWTVRP